MFKKKLVWEIHCLRLTFSVLQSLWSYSHHLQSVEIWQNKRVFPPTVFAIAQKKVCVNCSRKDWYWYSHSGFDIRIVYVCYLWCLRTGIALIKVTGTAKLFKIKEVLWQGNAEWTGPESKFKIDYVVRISAFQLMFGLFHCILYLASCTLLAPHRRHLRWQHCGPQRRSRCFIHCQYYRFPKYVVLKSAPKQLLTWVDNIVGTVQYFSQTDSDVVEVEFSHTLM